MTRPLSKTNLALNRAPDAGTMVPLLDPETSGTLTVWFDVSDPAARTVFDDVTDVVTNLENKAAADSSNDAEADDGITATAGFEFVPSQYNGLDTGFSDDSPFRAMAVRDLVQVFSRVGSGGFRCFFVGGTAASETLGAFMMTNGARDPSGGGYTVTINSPSTGRVRWQMFDESTSGNALTAADAAIDVTDGDPHVYMIGRSVGTGTGGVDELVGSVDGVVPTGLPADLPAALGACDNDGATNVAAGWLIWGAAGNAPNVAWFHQRAFHGEILLYKNDMGASDVADVIEYLTIRWL